MTDKFDWVKNELSTSKMTLILPDIGNASESFRYLVQGQQTTLVARFTNDNVDMAVFRRQMKKFCDTLFLEISITEKSTGIIVDDLKCRPKLIGEENPRASYRHYSALEKPAVDLSVDFDVNLDSRYFEVELMLAVSVSIEFLSLFDFTVPELTAGDRSSSVINDDAGRLPHSLIHRRSNIIAQVSRLIPDNLAHYVDSIPSPLSCECDVMVVDPLSLVSSLITSCGDKMIVSMTLSNRHPQFGIDVQQVTVNLTKPITWLTGHRSISLPSRGSGFCVCYSLGWKYVGPHTAVIEWRMNSRSYLKPVVINSQNPSPVLLTMDVTQPVCLLQPCLINFSAFSHSTNFQRLRIQLKSSAEVLFDQEELDFGCVMVDRESVRLPLKIVPLKRGLLSLNDLVTVLCLVDGVIDQNYRPASSSLQLLVV